MPATTENAPFRGACLTIHGDLPEFVNHPEPPSAIAYFAFAQETCPSNGKKHWQCFAYATKAMRLTGWKKIFKTAHIEQMRGTFQQNEKYCSKEGKLTEMGTPPMDNGKKRSLQDLCTEVREGAQEGKPLSDIIMESEQQHTFVQYHAGIKTLHSMAVSYKLSRVDKDYAPEVTYIYGTPGCGKTRYVHKHEPQLYDCPEPAFYGWKDGYSGQDAVLYDNMRPDNIKPVTLLKEIDRYFIQVPIKGGFIGWRPKRIYITSLYKPRQLAEQAGFSNPDEFIRRLTKIIDMDEKKGITL